jgi:hypothetical protein
LPPRKYRLLVSLRLIWKESVEVDDPMQVWLRDALQLMGQLRHVSKGFDIGYVAIVMRNSQVRDDMVQKLFGEFVHDGSRLDEHADLAMCQSKETSHHGAFTALYCVPTKIYT